MRSPVQIGSIFAVVFLFYFLFALWPHDTVPRPTFLPSATHIKIVRPLGADKQPYRVFVTSPLQPPVLDITVTGEPLADGLVLNPNAIPTLGDRPTEAISRTDPSRSSSLRARRSPGCPGGTRRSTSPGGTP